MIKKEMKISEVIRKYPGVAPLLMKFRICDCCGGDNALEKAARGAGMDLKKLMMELNAAVGE
ncbi:MAG: DUF542 domain-containing protein [Candidatus Hydrothermarchaeaceae archaeon]